MRIEMGREGENERDRSVGDRERGTQGSFHSLCRRAPIAAVQVGQKLAWDKEENPCFHMRANVLSGTLPGALLI